MSKFTRFTVKHDAAISAVLKEFQNSVFNFFLNKVTDGALRIPNGNLFQTVGAA